jgi:hypothetical protein
MPNLNIGKSSEARRRTPGLKLPNPIEKLQIKQSPNIKLPTFKP